MPLHPFRREILLRIAVLGLLPLTASCSDDEPTAGSDGPASADLEVTVSGPENEFAGLEALYRVRARNTGPDRAEDVLITAVVQGAEEVVAVSDQGTVTGSTVEWPSFTLLSGSRRTLDVTLRAPEDGSFGLTASGTSSTDDPNPANNDGSGTDATITTQVTQHADVQVTMTGPDEAKPLDDLTYEVRVKNLGPAEAEQVQTSVSIDITLVDQTGGLDGQVIELAPIAMLPAGDSAVFDLAIDAPSIGPVDLMASATSTTPDAFPANGDGSASASRVRLTIGFDVLYQLVGEATGDLFGSQVENLGDVDGDGAADFIVAAPRNDGGGEDAGRIYVYSGASGNELFRFSGGSGDMVGTGVDLAGDIDGDMVPDVIVGALGAGSAHILSGTDGSLIRTITGAVAEEFGLAVGRAGDVNNDGRDDVAVGAPGADFGGVNAGRMYVYSGMDGSLLFTQDAERVTGGLGSGVGGPGDLNGDGFDDVIGGAPFAEGGRVFVISGATGSTLYPPIAPPATGQVLGLTWLAGLGDVDGDNVPDIYAADLADNSAAETAGRAYVFSGADGSTIHTFAGEAAGDEFGRGRGAGADVDGDGVQEVFVAAWLNDEGGTEAGKAYLFSGASGELLRTFTHRTAGEVFGFDAVGIGDVDGDALPDFLVSLDVSLTQTPGTVLVVKGVPIQ